MKLRVSCLVFLFGLALVTSGFSSRRGDSQDLGSHLLRFDYKLRQKLKYHVYGRQVEKDASGDETLTTSGSGIVLVEVSEVSQDGEARLKMEAEDIDLFRGKRRTPWSLPNTHGEYIVNPQGITTMLQRGSLSRNLPVFPSGPVRVGDSWSGVADMEEFIFCQGTESTEAEITYTLKEVSGEFGNTMAIIEGEGYLDVGPCPVNRATIGAEPPAADFLRHNSTVGQVMPGGPADLAGIKRGDIIVEFNGVDINCWHDLRFITGFTRVKKEVNVRVKRDDEILNLRMLPDFIKDSDVRAEGQFGVTVIFDCELGIVRELKVEAKDLIVESICDGSPVPSTLELYMKKTLIGMTN